MSLLVSDPKSMRQTEPAEAIHFVSRRLEKSLAVAGKVFARACALLLAAIATPNKTRALVITDKVALTDKSLLAIANIEGKKFLIGAAPSGITLLAELNPPKGAGTKSRKANCAVVSRKKKSAVEESAA